MLDIVRNEMIEINDRFTKKNCEFLYRIVDISQDSDIVYQIPFEMTDSESKSKSKGDNKRTQASCRQTAMHQQVHEIHNIEIVEHRVALENDETDDEHLDDRLESEQIMVPSGKFLIDERYVKAAPWFHIPLYCREMRPDNFRSLTFRSVQMEFQSHKRMDFMVQSDIRH